MNKEERIKQQMKAAKKAKMKMKREKKKERIKQQSANLNSVNLICRKKVKVALISTIIILIALIGRLFYLQMVDGERLYDLALKQQTTTEIISSKRGNIYDATGSSLAISEAVDTITINPSKIKGKTDEATNELKNKLAKGLSEIFELDYKETLEKINSTSLLKQ